MCPTRGVKRLGERGRWVKAQLMCDPLVALKSVADAASEARRKAALQGRDSRAALTQQLALGGAALGLRGSQESPDQGEACSRVDYKMAKLVLHTSGRRVRKLIRSECQCGHSAGKERRSGTWGYPRTTTARHARREKRKGPSRAA